MKTALVAAFVLTTSINAFAACEYTAIMNADDDERITFSMKVNKMTERHGGISFDQRDNELDELSAGCISCHDGSLGKGGNVRMKSGDSSVSDSHPIGIDYNSISYRKHGYRNIHNVRTEIKFVDGRLGCLSCHDLNNKEKSHLAAPLKGSALCFSCHAK